MKNLEKAIHIIGIDIRTTNEDGRSFNDIPPLWERFMKEECAAKIPNKLDNDIYAVYTNFENEGKNNQGMYSLIIGCNVAPETTPPKNFTKIIIPSGNYRVFPVEKGRPDKVGEAWQSIWAIPESEKHKWSFICEFECYYASNEIDIYIGVTN
jgi:predicted transcriptional regulator YdeE